MKLHALSGLRIVPALFAAALFALRAGAADPRSIGSGAAAALPVIHNPDPDAEISVRATGKLLRLQGVTRSGALPSGSAAARLAESGVCFKWEPSPRDTSQLAEADLTDAALSPDESTLLLVERIGGSDAPNSTRLVFLALAEGGIIRVIDLPNRRIREICWSPDGLFARQEAQPELASPAAFLRIELPDGSVSAVSRPIALPPTGWCVGGGFLWYGEQGGKFFCRLPAAGVDGTPRRFRSGLSSPRPLWIPDRHRFVLYGTGGAEFYRMGGDGLPELEFHTPLPAGFAPETAVPLNGEHEAALLQPGKPVLVLAGGAVRQLGGRTGKLLCFLRRPSLLIFEEQQRHSLRPCPMPFGDPAPAFSPGKLKPLNRNANFRLLPLSAPGASALLIDAKANVSRIDFGGKRPQKSVVFEAVPSERRRR